VFEALFVVLDIPVFVLGVRGANDGCGALEGEGVDHIADLCGETEKGGVELVRDGAWSG
jgi:hypothetical protein